MAETVEASRMNDADDADDAWCPNCSKLWRERFEAGMRAREWEVEGLEAQVKKLQAELDEARQWRAAAIGLSTADTVRRYGGLLNRLGEGPGSECLDAPHRGPQGPNEDIAQCPRCWSPTYSLRPAGETFGNHLPDCSLPLRHESFCEPGGDGHPEAAKVRG
jgi:hypothetical protein